MGVWRTEAFFYFFATVFLAAAADFLVVAPFLGAAAFLATAVFLGAAAFFRAAGFLGAAGAFAPADFLAPVDCLTVVLALGFFSLEVGLTTKKIKKYCLSIVLF